MREQSKDKDRLQHILECIDNVFQFLDGKTFEDITNNRMCFHAVIYNIMIIGVAANKTKTPHGATLLTCATC